jgi:ribonuclease HI/F0F1-type ATP synthase delta subunit
MLVGQSVVNDLSHILSKPDKSGRSKDADDEDKTSKQQRTRVRNVVEDVQNNTKRNSQRQDFRRIFHTLTMSTSEKVETAKKAFDDYLDQLGKDFSDVVLGNKRPECLGRDQLMHLLALHTHAKACQMVEKLQDNSQNHAKACELVEKLEDNSQKKRKIHEVTPSPREPIVVHTDGSCKSNGTARAIGGWGVTTSSGVQIYGRLAALPTNQRAELAAAIVGALAAGTGEAVLKTDSAYVVLGVTEESRLETWATNGWKTKAKTSVANIDLWKALHEILVLRKERGYPTITFKHIPRAENAAADRLASAGCTEKTYSIASVDDAAKDHFTALLNRNKDLFGF